MKDAKSKYLSSGLFTFGDDVVRDLYSPSGVYIYIYIYIHEYHIWYNEITTYFPSAIKRTTLINRGIDVDYFNPKTISMIRKENALIDLNISENKHIILLPGRLTSWKGHNIAIEAAKKLNILMPDLNFIMIFVGSHQNRKEYLNSLKKRIERYDLSNFILLSGPRLDMPAIYNLADVVLSTSTEPEAFGRVSAEASAMCKPIIASNHGGSIFIIDNDVTGWLVKPDDPNDLAKK